MRRIFALLWLMLSLAPARAAEEKAPSMPREIRELTDFYERRARQAVRDFLGPDTHVVVSVYLRGKVAEGKEATPSAKDGNPNWLLVGPFIPSVSDLKNSGVAIDNSLDVATAEISIQVESAVTPEIRTQLSDVVRAALREVPVKVVVGASLPQPIAKEISKKEAVADQRKPASEETPNAVPANDFWTILSQRFGFMVPLLAALILAASFLPVSGGLRSAAHEITEGIKSSGSSRSSASSSFGQAPMASATARETLATPAKSGTASVSRASSATFSSPADARRNVQVIERYLRESPSLIVRMLGDGAEDVLGLSYLISRLSPESNQILKNLLGAERLVKLNSFRTGDDIIGFDANGWIQQLVQRLEIRRLAGGDLIEQAISADQSSLLANASAEILMQVALKMDQPAAWRVISEFLPSDFLNDGDNLSEDRVWIGLLRGARVTDTESVRQAANEIVELVRVAASENAIQMREQIETREHFKRRILPVLVDAIMDKPLGEDDRIVDLALAEMPECAELIFERIWTPKRLDAVPDASLKALVMGQGLDNERRAYLLFALPETQARRIEALLPEGTLKKIVVDIASRLRTTADEERKASIRSWTRQFLQALRLEAAAGRLKLKTQAPSVRSVPSELSDEIYERKAS